MEALLWLVNLVVTTIVGGFLGGATDWILALIEGALSLDGLA